VLLGLLALAGLVWWLIVPQIRGWYHLHAGRAALERYHSREALEHLQASLQVWPGDAQVLLAAARAARRLGEFERASAYLDRCADKAHLGEDVALERVLLRAARGDLDGVRPYCLALIEQGHPASSLIREALVHGYVHAYRIQEAAVHLKHWRQREPNNPQALFVEGVMQSQMLNHAGAAEAFRQALAQDPDHDAARLALLAVLLQDLSQPAEALPHAEYLRRRMPTNWTVKVRLASCLARLERAAQAEQLLDEVLAEQPRFGLALVERGKLAMHARQLERAEALLRAACAQLADYPAHYQLFLCLGQQGKTAEAREVLKRVDQLKEDLRRLHEIAFEKMPRAPHDAALHRELGDILLRTGGVEEGLRWLHSALREDPKHAPAHASLADYYEAIGQLGRADRHRSQARAATADRPR
jgi:tetratricopeptide (TPR) repeat protein